MGAKTMRFDSATLPLAVWSFATARMVDAHVRNVYAWGDMLRTQANAVADASGHMHAGALRDAVSAWGHAGKLIGELVIDAASRWGRRYGGLAFAVPVPTFHE